MLSLVDEILCIWISIYATLKDPAKTFQFMGCFIFYFYSACCSIMRERMIIRSCMCVVFPVLKRILFLLAIAAQFKFKKEFYSSQ